MCCGEERPTRPLDFCLPRCVKGRRRRTGINASLLLLSLSSLSLSLAGLETIVNPAEARKWLLDREIVLRSVLLSTRIRAPTSPTCRNCWLAEFLIGGMSIFATCPATWFATGAGPRTGRVTEYPMLLPNTLYNLRHHLLDLRRADAQPAVLAGPPRRDAADEGYLRVPSGLRRTHHRVVGRSRASWGQPPSGR